MTYRNLIVVTVKAQEKRNGVAQVVPHHESLDFDGSKDIYSQSWSRAYWKDSLDQIFAAGAEILKDYRIKCFGGLGKLRWVLSILSASWWLLHNSEKWSIRCKVTFHQIEYVADKSIFIDTLCSLNECCVSRPLGFNTSTIVIYYELFQWNRSLWYARIDRTLYVPLFPWCILKWHRCL